MPKDDCHSDSDSDSDWNEELLNAIRKKQGKKETITEEDRIKRIQECLDEGADVDALDKNNNTGLHLAVKKGFVKVVQFLVGQRARTDILDRNGNTALNLAETPGKEDLLRALKGLPDYGNQRACTSRDGNQISVKDAGDDLKRKNSADDEDRDSGKRRRLSNARGDAEEQEIEEIGFGEDFEIEDEDIVSHATSRFDEYDRHAASGLKQTLHGNIYQLKLLMLFLKRGLREGYAFRLATEMDAAEKFDDLVFQYEDKTGSGTVYRFLQAKHKQDETKTIGARDLLTEKDDEFSLQKYFISYRKMMKNSELSKSAFKDFVLCTNIDFDFEGLESAKIRLEEVKEPDSFLDIKSSAKKTARYKFIVDEQSELHEILERTAEAYTLAKMLVEHVYESKDITLRNDIFRLYHTAMAEEVVDVGRKQLSGDFIEGRNLSERGKKFRKIFYAEALKQKKLSDKDTSEDAMWKEIGKYPLKVSSTFGQHFKLTPDPRLTPIRQFTDELVKLIKNADANKLVKVNRKIYRKNAREGSNEKVFADNVDKLAGHVLIMEDEKIKFRSQFFDDNIKPPGNIGELRDLLKAQLGITLYNDLVRYQLEINNFKTCEEEQLFSKTELPGDEVDGKEIAGFFDKLVFAVNQPNEIELGDVITREIAADSKFNLLNADLVGDSFQREMLDWFKEKGREKGKEGRFFSAADGRAFFDSAERKVNTLVSSGLSLSYPEELEGYGVEFSDENEELRDFLTPDSGYGARPALNIIATGETLPTAIRVHRAVRRTGRYEENDSLMFLRLSTLRLPGIRKRVIRAFESPESHRLLVIDCESAGKQDLQGLYNRFCETVKRRVGKKLILVTRGNDPSANRLKIRFKNCYETYDDVSFNNLTAESRHKLFAKLAINFQEHPVRTSFGKLLGIHGCADVASQELTEFGDFVDTGTLVKLIRGEEIRVGSDLKGLGEIESYYINRTINRQVFIRNDIFKSQSSDLFAISGVNRGALTSLVNDGGTIRYFDEIDSREIRPNELIILNSERATGQFETLCENPFVNVHWLKWEWGKLLWIKSRGNIDALMKHRDVDESRDIPDEKLNGITPRILTEDQLIDHAAERRVVIISDSAGMGKSTVFTYLAKRMKDKKPALWVIKIDLNDFTDALNEELKRQSLKGSDVDAAVEFFVEKLSDLKTDLEKKVLKTMIKNRGGVALLFDGFDEISPDYKDIVIDLLKAFEKTCVEKLYVATRPHMRELLEIKLGTFSYTIKPFSEEDQIDFMVRFWKTGLGLVGIEQRIEERLKTYAKALILKIVKSIDDRVKEFAGIPLQTRMIAEIFQDDREGNVGLQGSEVCEEFLRSEDDEPRLSGKMRIVDLYGSFVDKKYYVYRTEKKKGIATNLGEKRDNRDLREIFLKWHQKLALHTMFNDEGLVNFLGPPVLPVLLEQREIEGVNAYVSEIIEGKERTGIITQVVNGKPQFIHRTFAEYFAAIYLINSLRQADHNSQLREFIVKQILSEPKYRIIRAFLNGLLPEYSSSDRQDVAGNGSVTESWKLVLCEFRTTLGGSVFHIAVDEGNYQIVKFLLNRFDRHDDTRKGLINAKNSFGDTIPHMAATHQHWDELMWLVQDEGAEINSLTDNGRSALHAAASRGNLRMVKWLVKNGALPNAITNKGTTPLYEAVRSGLLPVLKWLINETGANVNSRNKYGKTVLHFAASIGQLGVVECLVDERNADPNVRMNDGKTVLHEAADKGHWDVVKWLIEKGKVDVDSTGHKDGTVLQIAASFGDLDMVKWLVERGANADAKSTDGNTILHVAVADRRWTVFRWLVENGADVNVKSWIGNTVLHETAARKKWDVVKWLVEETNADVNAKGVGNLTVLHSAARSRQWDLVKFLLENGNADVNAVALNEGTALYHAASQERWDTVKWLIKDKNADVNVKSLDGKTVLQIAAVKEKWDLVNWLVLDRGADVNIRANDGTTLLHHAAALGQFDLVKSVIEERGMDIDVRTNDGKTVLHFAAASGLLASIKWLVDEKGADIEARSYKGETPLHVAASGMQWDVVKWLIEEKGANVQAETNDGLTVLHSAACFRKWDLVRILANSSNVDFNSETRDGFTVLRYAVESADLEFVKWLIEDKGIDVNSRFINGKTILHYAVASGNFQVVEWLVDHKNGDIKAADMNGKTLLHVAASAGQCEIFKWLVDKRAADIEAQDNDGRTVLHGAAVAANLDMIRLLVETYNVDVVATDDSDDTALNLYCKTHRRRDEAIVQLLQRGDCNLQTVLSRRRFSCLAPSRRIRSRNQRRQAIARRKMMRDFY